ncbi:hypothetical protein GF312_22945 [Candidatus Poribacteria bacterium]|nr:hypothetical protein [Candidatus Poribacteria bacterium]
MKYNKLVNTISLVFAFVIMITPGNSQAEITQESIVGAWLFDEGAGEKAMDITRKSADGLLTGGPSWVDGKYGQALGFDGSDDYLEIALPEILNNIPGNSFSVVYWINVRDITGSGNIWTRVIEARFDNVNYFQFVIQINDGEFGVNHVADGSERTVITDNPISADTWYHAALVWDATQATIKFYLDGVLQSGVGTTPASPGDKKEINIGRRTDGNIDTYFDGIIDEFAILNVVLTEEDIETIMDYGLFVIAPVSSKGKLATLWSKIKD